MLTELLRTAPSSFGERLLSGSPERLLGFLVHDGVLMLNIAATSVFASANQELSERPQGGRAPSYRVLLLSARGGPIRTSCGIELFTRAIADFDPAEFDTLTVPGGVAVRDLAEDETVLAWLRRAGAARRVASSGGGAFVLAKAGLLNNRRCVTHWRYVSALQREFPQVQVEPDALFVIDGNCITTAGSSGVLDLAMHMVEEDHGKLLAMDVARALVVVRKRSGEQPQFSAELQAQAAASPKVTAAAEWIIANIERKPSVARLAEQFCMSERNFSRVFTREIGMSPQRFVERAKLEAARRWLAESDLPVEKVARRTGYSCGEHMAQSFRKAMGSTPGEYRARVRSSVAA